MTCSEWNVAALSLQGGATAPKLLVVGGARLVKQSHPSLQAQLSTEQAGVSCVHGVKPLVPAGL